MGEIGQALTTRSPGFGLPDGLTDSLAWESLTVDSGADVAVIDAHGRVLYMTRRPTLWFIPESVGDPVGKSVFELFPRELAEERLGYLQRVSRERKPLIVMTMWRGVRARATMRPILAPGNAQPAVLVVCRSVQEWNTDAESGDARIVHARVVDLGPLAQLTPRELEVLALIGDGATTQEIAQRLCRSAKTVEAHRQSLGLKLKAKNRVELARIAVRADLSAQLRQAGGLGEPPPPSEDPRRVGGAPQPMRTEGTPGGHAGPERELSRMDRLMGEPRAASGRNGHGH